MAHALAGKPVQEQDIIDVQTIVDAYFDNVPDEIQPGVHVRTINGKYLSDEEMLAYYTNCVYNNKRYKNYLGGTLCSVLNLTKKSPWPWALAYWL